MMPIKLFVCIAVIVFIFSSGIKSGYDYAFDLLKIKSAQLKSQEERLTLSQKAMSEVDIDEFKDPINPKNFYNYLASNIR